MTTKPTLAAQIAARSIDHLVDDMWNNLGGLYPAVVLLEVAERTEPADKETVRKVKLQVVNIEIPHTDLTREDLKRQLREMYARRTGEDTLFADGTTNSDFSWGDVKITVSSPERPHLSAIPDDADPDDDAGE